VLQEINHLFKLLLGLVFTRYVLEGNASVGHSFLKHTVGHHFHLACGLSYVLQPNQQRKGDEPVS
jgi:hypothetical protein